MRRRNPNRILALNFTLLESVLENIMPKKASDILVSIDDLFRLDTDGDLNVMVMFKQVTDKAHHKAKDDGPDHRWVCLGYYATVKTALNNTQKFMLKHYGSGNETIDGLIKIINDSEAKILAATKKIS